MTILTCSDRAKFRPLSPGFLGLENVSSWKPVEPLPAVVMSSRRLPRENHVHRVDLGCRRLLFACGAAFPIVRKAGLRLGGTVRALPGSSGLHGPMHFHKLGQVRHTA